MNKIVLRDNQRSKVYKFESTYNDYSLILSLQECRDFLEILKKEFPWMQKVHISDGRGSRRAFYRYFDGRIRLPRKWRTKMMICHEFAHGLTYESGLPHQPHGPEFVHNMISLQKKYCPEGSKRPWSEVEKDAYKLGYRP
jgi:hypothetical protein